MTEETDKPTNPQGEGPPKPEGDGLTKSERMFVRIYFSGRVISAGEEVDVVLARDEIARVVLQKAYAAPTRLEWEVCYCSVFNKCWVSNSKGQSWLKAATLVEACPDYGSGQFLD